MLQQRIWPAGNILRKRRNLPPFFFSGIFSAAIVFLSTWAFAEGGSVQGLVKFPGETPPPAMWSNRDDADCPHGIAQNHLSVRQENLGLQNAVVYVDTEQHVVMHLSTATLSADGCILLPRIQWAPLGTNLGLVNKGKAHHHLHGFIRDTTDFEVDLPPGGTARRPLIHPGFLRVDCDKHLWERAWIYVSQNPWVAITDASGRYEISDVPPGHYAIHAWHEGWQDEGQGADGRTQFTAMSESLDAQVRKKRATRVIFDQLTPVQ